MPSGGSGRRNVFRSSPVKVVTNCGRNAFRVPLRGPPYATRSLDRESPKDQGGMLSFVPSCEIFLKWDARRAQLHDDIAPPKDAASGEFLAARAISPFANTGRLRFWLAAESDNLADHSRIAPAIQDSQNDGSEPFLNKVNNVVGLLQNGSLHIPVFFWKAIRIPFNPIDRFLVLLEDMVPAIASPRTVMFYRTFQIGLNFRKFKDRLAPHSDRSLFIISACGMGTLLPA